MNQRLDSLHRLYLLKERKTLEAFKELTRARELYELNKSRQAQLTGYRQDYLNQIQALGNKGSSIARLRNRIDFIHNLEIALEQLNRQLLQLQGQCNHFESRYLTAKAAEDAVLKLMDRVKEAESAKLNRAEQKENDEYAQKQWYSKNNNL